MSHRVFSDDAVRFVRLDSPLAMMNQRPFVRVCLVVGLPIIVVPSGCFKRETLPSSESEGDSEASDGTSGVSGGSSADASNGSSSSMSSGSSDSDESSADGSTEATSDATGSSSGADTGDILPCVDEILTAPSIIQSTTLAAGDDEASDCGGAGSEDLVYQLTADVAGFYSFDTTGSVLDTLLYATRGTCTSPIEWCSDDVDPDTNSYQSHIGMYAEAGQRMLVMVDGASGESGSFSLSVGVEPGPCTVTNAMPSVPSVTSWTTTGASDRTSASCGGGGAPDLRFLWVAPADGTYAISTMGATFDTLLYVLDGVCGEELGCNDDDGSGGTTSQVTLDLVAGQTITAVIDGWGAMSGDFSLHIDAVMAHE